MNPRQSLQSLQAQINYRVLRLRRLYHYSKAVPSAAYSDELLAVSTIELDNLIVSGLRCYVISCLSSARRVSGGRVNTSLKFFAEEEIGAFILKTLNSVKYGKLNNPKTIQRNDEPTVRFPREVRAILVQANSSNVAALDQAISLNSPVFDVLCTVRNFYAHRNKDTWRKVVTKAQGQGHFSVRYPKDFLHAPVRGLGISVMEDWMDDITIFFDYAVK